jgi:GNAT superfamily N-acetyltransferase
MAYGSTLAQEQAYSEELWRERASGPAAGCDRATFIAEREGIWIGMVTGLANHDGQGNAGPLLVAMFVDSSARRQCIGVGLTEAVCTWARNCGADQLTLWVTSGNNPAVALYRRCGFRFTGKTRPVAHTPALAEHEMVRDLR